MLTLVAAEVKNCFLKLVRRNKEKPCVKNRPARQDSLEKQIREMLEWLQADSNLSKGNEKPSERSPAAECRST